MSFFLAVNPYLQKLSIIVVTFILLFIALFSPAFAQTTDPYPNSGSTEKSLLESSTNLATTSAIHGGGQSLGIFDFVGDAFSCVTHPVDCIGGAVGDALSFIFKYLMEIVARIMVYVLHLIAAALGSDTGQACAQSGGDDAQCVAMANRLAQFDPLFRQTASTTTSSINLFTLMDSSYSTLYASIPQINPVDELTYIAKNSVLGVSDAHAQGVGTETLGELIRSVWSKMRDLAYIFSVVVLLVIGFMVMFRRRLDPRTVVTATNSLPKVAIALVLITFSFAISGLFVDLIFVIVGITRGYFEDLPGISGALSSLANTLGTGEFVWLPFFTLISESVISWHVFLGVLAVALIGAIPTVGFSLLLAIPLIAALALDILIRLGLFVLAILLFWALLKRYITMVLLTVFSPFFFLAGAIPGFETAINSWFKRMLAAVLTFPVILVVVYIAVALLSPAIGDGIGAPDPIKGASFFLNLSALAGLGVLYFANQVPGMIDELLGTRGPRDRGVSPLLLVGGAIGAAQTMTTVSRASPMMAGWMKGSAYQPGPRGRLAGWGTNVLGFFNPNVKFKQEEITARRGNPPPPSGRPKRFTLFPNRDRQTGEPPPDNVVPFRPRGGPPGGPPPETPPTTPRPPTEGGENPYRPDEDD
ncbi:MAG TPA: hypothetical protein VIH52_04795 [Candidatus Nanoarchaeia archaeon]